MKEVLIATNNAHKVEEIRTALNFEGWTFTTLAEAGVTSDPAGGRRQLRGQRRIKARAARAAARESLGRFVAVLADGLRFGGGRPGRRAWGSSRRATRDPTGTMRPTTRSFWPSLPPCRMPSARHGSCARSCSSTRTVRNRWPAAPSRVPSDANPAAARASATTRCFARRVRRHAGAGRGLPGREERHISSGKCLARAQKGPFPKR